MPTRSLTIPVIILVLFCRPIVWAETVTLVADEWPPFNATPNTSEEGVLVDVARAVFKKNGVQVSYKLIPWRRAVELTRMGTYHGIDAIVDNEAVILHVARRMGVNDQIKLAGHGSEIAYIYIAFSPKRADSQRYARMLSAGVVQLRRTGQLAVILSKYGLKDWK